MGTYIAAVSPGEANLISRIQAREEGAFYELFQQFRAKIYRTALKILKEEQSAQDALQETFLNVHRAVSNFRGDSTVGTWINRITVNVCLEMIRKNKKHGQRTDEDVSENVQIPDGHSRTPLERVCQLETQQRVHGALARLSRKHRVVVKKHDLEGYTIREIAAALRISEGTIKSRLFYGRETLKAKLAPDAAPRAA